MTRNQPRLPSTLVLGWRLISMQQRPSGIRGGRTIRASLPHRSVRRGAAGAMRSCRKAAFGIISHHARIRPRTVCCTSIHSRIGKTTMQQRLATCARTSVLHSARRRADHVPPLPRAARSMAAVPAAARPRGSLGRRIQSAAATRCARCGRAIASCAAESNGSSTCGAAAHLHHHASATLHHRRGESHGSSPKCHFGQHQQPPLDSLRPAGGRSLSGVWALGDAASGPRAPRCLRNYWKRTDAEH